MNLEDRVETLAPKSLFVTLKDHKDNFRNNPTCRLINPTMSEIGKISKRILDRINKAVIEKTRVNQWKNTREVLDWFSNIQNKQSHSFIAFDVANFYPSIAEQLLEQALKFAGNFTNISQEDRDVIFHAKQSLLFDEEIPWTKKDTHNSFESLLRVLKSP